MTVRPFWSVKLNGPPIAAVCGALGGEIGRAHDQHEPETGTSPARKAAATSRPRRLRGVIFDRFQGPSRRVHRQAAIPATIIS